jgi:hypothetical protein
MQKFQNLLISEKVYISLEETTTQYSLQQRKKEKNVFFVVAKKQRKIFFFALKSFCKILSLGDTTFRPKVTLQNPGEAPWTTW